MRLEVLLSVVNFKKKDLDKMNISSKCIVINQCGINSFERYKNFSIYSYDELGTSNSRNRGLEHVSEDLILLCDDDIVYNKDYEKMVLEEFKKNTKADVIIFNFVSPRRKKRIIKRRKRLHIYNSLNYATYNIAFRKDSILNNNIKFNTTFGPGAKYNSGEDSLFIRDLFKNGLKVYSSPLFLGIVYNDKSTWFNGYNKKFFFDKGALFTAINPKIRHFLILQYLIRHRDVLTDIKFREAFKFMLEGSREYLKDKVMENEWINYNNNKCI